MVRFYPFLIILFSLCFPGCDNEKAYVLDSEAIANTTISQGFSRHTVGLGLDDEFRFGLWIPEIPANRKVPLVVALHYAGLATPFRGDVYMKQLVQPALQDFGGIIIAPDAPDETWADRKSEQILMSLIKIVKNEWPVDPEQIIITGYSMGGICTWYLADKYPGEFCAAIPIASSPMGFLTGKVPHYVIQGEFDQEFGTASVKRAVGIMKLKNRRAELVIADSLFHADAGRYIPYLRQSIPWINEQMINNKQ